MSAHHSPADSSAEDAARKVRSMLADGVKWADSRKRRFRRAASSVRLTSLALTATSTVVLGLQDLNFWADLAFSMVAVTTAINALEPFFNWRSRWILMEEAQYKLNRILDELDFNLAGSSSNKIEIDVIERYFERHEEVWNEISNRWVQQRRLERGDRTPTE